MTGAERTFFALGLLVLTGCTHVQLKKNTLHQAKAIHQLQQQQVLDNLAMFTVDPNAVPYFSVIGTGSSAITDQAGVGTSLSWLRTGFQSVGLDLDASRAAQENFTLSAINDPNILARMRCSYQAAIGTGGYPCIDCCELDRAWGNKTWTGRSNATCPDPCMPGPGWYCIGNRKDVPSCALYVGSFKDNYVWVTPDGTDELARLTLTILDYATGEVPSPLAPATKQVKTTTYNYNGPLLQSTTETTQTVLDETATKNVNSANAPRTPEAIMTPAPSTRRRNFDTISPLPQIVIPLR